MVKNTSLQCVLAIRSVISIYLPSLISNATSSTRICFQVTIVISTVYSKQKVEVLQDVLNGGPRVKPQIVLNTNLNVRLHTIH